eukprot:SAG11_NODE_12458_length_702_cov_1.122720_2_plen_104_part_01
MKIPVDLEQRRILCEVCYSPVSLEAYNNAAPFVDDKYRCSHWMQSLSVEIQNNVLVTFQAKGYDSVEDIPYDLAVKFVRDTYESDDILAQKIEEYYDIKQGEHE